MSALVRQYADFCRGAADASVTALAERPNITDVATQGHRNFTIGPGRLLNGAGRIGSGSRRGHVKIAQVHDPLQNAVGP
jgi:hypothetical protein